MIRLGAQQHRQPPDAQTELHSPQAMKPSRVRYRVVALGCGLALLTYVQRQAFVRAMPEIRNDLGLNTEQMGLLAAGFLLVYGLFQVPYGLIGDRLGARHLLTILVLGWSLLTAAAALAGILPTGVAWQFALLVGIRLVFGIFQSGGFPVWARVMTDWMPASERATGQARSGCSAGSVARSARLFSCGCFNISEPGAPRSASLPDWALCGASPFGPGFAIDPKTCPRSMPPNAR